MERADVVIIGAGIAGVSTAYALAVDRGITNVAIIDPRPPLTLTSDKSTESYRNWWPDRPMVGLMNRSIDLLEAMSYLSDNAFGMNRRGYLFVTGNEATLAQLVTQAGKTAALGAASEVFDRRELRHWHPYLASEAAGAVFAKRAGWFDAQQLGTWMLGRARSVGVELIRGEATDVIVQSDSVAGVAIDDGTVMSVDPSIDIWLSS